MTREVPRRLIETAYDSAVSPERWRDFLEHLAPLLGASTLHFVARFPNEGEPAVAWSTGAKPDFESAYAERFVAIDPWLQRPDLMTAGSAASGDQLLPAADFQRGEFYRSWMQPQDLLHPIVVLLHKAEGRTVSALSGFRHKSGEPFGAAERELLETLAPHLQRALAIHRSLRSTELVRDAALETLDRMSEGWILLGRGSSVLASNRAARQLLERGGALRVEAGRLVAGADVPGERLHQLLARATGAAGEVSGGAIELPGPDGTPLRAVTSPLRGGGSGAGAPLAVLYVGAPDNGGEQSLEQLRDAYGLTHAEGRVALRLADGQRLSDIAGDLGISINTVRGHLKQVFAKTGTHRQAELVRLVLNGSRGIRVA